MYHFFQQCQVTRYASVAVCDQLCTTHCILYPVIGSTSGLASMIVFMMMISISSMDIRWMVWSLFWSSDCSHPMFRWSDCADPVASTANYSPLAALNEVHKILVIISGLSRHFSHERSRVASTIRLLSE